MSEPLDWNAKTIAEFRANERRESKQHRGAEVAVDPDRIQDRRWVHDAMIECWQVSAHHQDQVSVLTGRACRQ